MDGPSCSNPFFAKVPLPFIIATGALTRQGQRLYGWAESLLRVGATQPAEEKAEKTSLLRMAGRP